MRTVKRNKQKMYYSLLGELKPKYKKDRDGNIIYDEVDGEMIPRETGEYEQTYDKPVEFHANISAKLHEVFIEAYGVDDSSSYAQIVAIKDSLPFVEGTLIWRKNEIKYLDEAQEEIDVESADYIVRGVMTENLSHDMFFLRRQSTIGSDIDGNN